MVMEMQITFFLVNISISIYFVLLKLNPPANTPTFLLSVFIMTHALRGECQQRSLIRDMPFHHLWHVAGMRRVSHQTDHITF